MELPERAVQRGATTRWLAAVVDETGGCADVDAVLRAVVGRTLDAFCADATAVVVGGEVVSRAGAGRTDGELCRAAVEPRADAVAVPVACAYAGYLVVVRTGVPFEPDERDLIAVLAAVASQAVTATSRLRSERSRGSRIAGRLADLERRQALATCLAAIHRAIARHAPLQEIFDTVTSGASDLFGDEVVGLRLVDADQPDTLLLVSCQGLAPQQVHRLWRARVTDAGASGLAVSTGQLVVFDQYQSSVAAIRELVDGGLSIAMAAPVRDNGVVVGALVVASFRADRCYADHERQMLTALADAVSLAITEAGTLDTMYRAFHDPLTGLTSRALFLDRLAHSLACSDRDGTRTGLLIVGLDRFRTVNDALGHAAGDHLLAAAAERLMTTIRAADTASRLDGDEFAVLLHGMGDPEQAILIARRIIQAFAVPFAVMGRQVFVTGSIGVAFTEAGQSDPQTLLRRANHALATAKRNGKGRYEVFTPSPNPAARNPFDVETDLRRALERDELFLRYQPIVELATARVTGFEALVRWQHPEHGLIQPLEFIPMAEETGLIVPIGAWVLDEACAQIAHWNSTRTDGPPLTVSVNLSARQLQHPELARTVAAALARVGLAPASLTLEITESMLIQDTDITIRRLQHLKGLGVRLAIDDFGTGYSSLAYLRRFPVDIIKIDKVFVDDLPSNTDGATLARAIVGLGRSLRLATIAEGIEAADQCGPLRDSGCELGQGYFFAKPLTADEVRALLDAAKAA